MLLFIPYRVDVPMQRLPWANLLLLGSTVALSVFSSFLLAMTIVTDVLLVTVAIQAFRMARRIETRFARLQATTRQPTTAPRPWASSTSRRGSSEACLP